MAKEEYRHDAVRENMVNIMNFVSNKKKQFIQYGIIVLMAILVIAYRQDHKKTQNIDANVAFGKALNLYLDDQKDIALPEFQIIIDDYDGTISADYARFYLLQDALVKKEQDRVDELMNDLDNTKDEIIRSAIYSMKADFAMNENDFDKALKYYQKASELSELDAFFSKYTIGTIRVMIAKGEYSEAVDKINILLDTDNLNYTDKNEIEELLAEVKFHEYR